MSEESKDASFHDALSNIEGLTDISNEQAKIIGLNAQIEVMAEILTGCAEGSQEEKLMKEGIANKKEEICKLSLKVAVSRSSSSQSALANDYGRMHMVAAQIAVMQKFKGLSADECNNFITGFRQLQQSFDLTDSELVKYAKSKMSSTSFRCVESHEKLNGAFSTFKDFESFIKAQWGGHLSVYQTLETAFNLNRSGKETWSQFAITLTQAMAKVKIGHQELLKSKDKKVTVETVYEMFTNSILLANINSQNHELYRAITSELKDLVTVNQLASRASSLAPMVGI